MKFAIQVHPNHNWQVSQHHARKLCDELLLSGHELVAVFFYGSCSNIAEINNRHDWIDWDASIAPLLVCSTLTQQMNINHDTNSVFDVTGMARWMQLLEQADQLVTIP
ncbi:hypothetical protein [Marinicella rhabdoformis]|uniref:hypothetical protein n=1 Tax=Marinicella rhabdoformis TaxID=2580566 RepID=UPI0012AED870|nr:hypothetical protein [Marinicella rhabdoformis]